MLRCLCLASAMVFSLLSAAAAKPVTPPVVDALPPMTSDQSRIPEDHIPALGPSQHEEGARIGPEDPRDPEIVNPSADETPLPEIIRETSTLPKPVARTREQLMDAARSGNVERLRIVIEGNELPPTLSLTAIGDPIDFLKEASGDAGGHEILAILLDVLEAGFLHVDAGTPQEMYLWPYFARYPLDRLTAEQKVEMYRIVTSWDFAEMQTYGVWSFYRVGIGPDGTWHFFVAGE